MKEKYYVVAKTISRWKLDNWFENWLGYKADKSEFWKKLYVLYYRLLDGKYYSGGVKLIDKEIERQMPNLEPEFREKLSREYLKRDMIYSLHRFGSCFEDYFVYKFYSRNALSRSGFNNLKMQYGYCEIVNPPSVRKLFEDKGALYNILKPYFKRNLVAVYSMTDFLAFKDFVRVHRNFIFKPLTGHSGMGIKIYRNFEGNEDDFFNQMLEKGAFVLEELIEQASPLKDLHPQSINTVRIATFRNGEEVSIIGAGVRMGAGGSTVDNAGAGGLYAGVDVEYGLIHSVGRDNLNNRYTLHPDTGCKIVGFELPEWENALELVNKVAKEKHGATMIAWDLAYSTKGWLVVEGNDVGDLRVLQAPYQIGLKYKYIELIDKYFLLKIKEIDKV